MDEQHETLVDLYLRLFVRVLKIVDDCLTFNDFKDSKKGRNLPTPQNCFLYRVLWAVLEKQFVTSPPSSTLHMWMTINENYVHQSGEGWENLRMTSRTIYLYIMKVLKHRPFHGVQNQFLEFFVNEIYRLQFVLDFYQTSYGRHT